MTVTGRTMAENLADIAPPDPDGKIIHATSTPIHRTGGLLILHGSLAPEGAVVKSASVEEPVFEGTAKVFDDEVDAMAAVTEGRIVAGDVVVIRYEGPKGGPGMREMLAVTAAIKGAGLGKDVLLLTDGRFSGGDHRVLHRARRARGSARRTDRLRRGRRPDPARHGGAHARPPGRRRRARAPPGRLEAPRAALHHRRAGQVRQARRLRAKGAVCD